MKWTNNTLVEKLPQFLNTLIHRLEKKKKRKTSGSSHHEKGSQFPTPHLSCSLSCNLYSKSLQGFIYFHPQGCRVSSLQHAEVGHTRTEKINHNARSRRTLALCLQQRRVFHKNIRPKSIGIYQVSDMECWCNFSAWIIYSFQRHRYEMRHFLEGDTMM